MATTTYTRHILLLVHNDIADMVSGIILTAVMFSLDSWLVVVLSHQIRNRLVTMQAFCEKIRRCYIRPLGDWSEK